VECKSHSVTVIFIKIGTISKSFRKFWTT